MQFLAYTNRGNGVIYPTIYHALSFKRVKLLSRAHGPLLNAYTRSFIRRKITKKSNLFPNSGKEQDQQNAD